MNAVASAPSRSERSHIALKPWDFWVLVLPLLAMAPMLVFQWQNLMSRPERQFFPALVVVAFFFPLRALLQQRSPQDPAVPVLRLIVALATFQFALLLYGLSVWGFSPWLAHVSAILVFFAWALGRCTASPWSSVLAWTGLLVIALPLPLNFDAKLVSSLQTASSWACSTALDALEVPHLRLANVIEMRGRQLFIEEACSGIGSMYALLAVAGLLVLINRRSLLVAVLTLVSVPVWAMLGNFLRLLTVALGQHFYQRDLSSGLDHELLGVLSFGVAALGLWTTEWMAASFLQPVPPADDDFAFLFRTINTCLCWPNPDPFTEIDMQADDPQWQRGQADRQAATHRAPPRRVSPWNLKPVRVLLRAGAAVALVLGTAPAILLARGSAADALDFGLPEYSQAALKNFPAADAMPARLGSWKRAGYRTQQRSTASLFGAHSLIWEYARGEERMLLSLDFPFRGAHPLEYCYRAAGWSVDEVTSMPVAGDSQWQWRELRMSSDFGSKACVYYSAFTAEGQTYAISQSEAVSGRFNRRLAQVFLSREPAYQPVCYQVQMLYEGGTQLSDAERSELRESFLDARTEMLAQIRALR